MDIGGSVMIRDEKGVVRNSFYSQKNKMENNTISVQYVKESNVDSDIKLYDYEIIDNKITIVKLY